MSELTPEQQAELDIVRSIAESLRRRLPDVDDVTLGRVMFNVADLFNGVAVVLMGNEETPVPDRRGGPAGWGESGGWDIDGPGMIIPPASGGPFEFFDPFKPFEQQQQQAQQPQPESVDVFDEPPPGPWRADFYQDGTQLEQAQWPEREQALRGVAGRVRWLAFDGTDVTVRLLGPGGIDLDHEAVLAAIEDLRRG